MHFDRIIGQERARQLVGRAMRNNRLGHALLIWGPSGTGKRALALEMAKGANCSVDPGNPCGSCVSCRKIASGVHPDVHTLIPCAHEECRSQKQRHGEAEMAPGDPGDGDDADWMARDFEMISEMARKPYTSPAPAPGEIISALKARRLRHDLGFRLREGRTKVALVLDAERMCPPYTPQPTAANVLLKVLEEPPPDTLLILTAPSPASLPATVVSRCRLVGLSRPPRSEIAKALEANGLDPQGALRASALADGDLRRAFEIAAGEGNDAEDEMKDVAYAFLSHLLSSDLEQALGTIDRLAGLAGAGQGERLKKVLVWSSVWLRDCLLLLGGCRDRVVSMGREVELTALAGRLSLSLACGWSDTIEQAMERLSRNVNPLLLLVVMAHGGPGRLGADNGRR